MARAAKGQGGLYRAPKGWRAYVTVDGKRVHTKAYSTKASAAAAKQDLIRQRDTGMLTPASGQIETVGEWLNHWVENIARLEPTTYATHRTIIDNRIIPALGRIRLDKLRREDVEAWVGSLEHPAQGRPLKPSSIHRYMAPLVTALNVAVQRGRVGRNVAAAVELPAVRRTQKETFSREDRTAILAAATGRNRLRWHLALQFGIRPGEALGITWHDFDEASRTLIIRHELLYAKGRGLYLKDATKSAAGVRQIRLPRALVTMFQDHRAEQLRERAEMGDEWEGWEYDGQPVALVFTQRNGRPIQARMDAAHWKALLTASGVETSRRYKARHTAASHLIRDTGGDVAVTAKMLGHADPSFTYRVYVHPLEEAEQQLAETMDEMYRSQDRSHPAESAPA